MVRATSGQGGKGDDLRPVDRSKWEKNAFRIWGICENKECSLRNSCYMFLKTVPFNADIRCLEPVDGKCEFYVKCKDTKTFRRMENDIR